MRLRSRPEIAAVTQSQQRRDTPDSVVEIGSHHDARSRSEPSATPAIGVTVCDPSLTELLAIELDEAGSVAASDLANALRDWWHDRDHP